MQEISSISIASLQAAGSNTFHIPSGFLEGKLSLPQVWDYHLEHSPDHPLFVYEKAPNDIQTITWSQGVRALHRAGRIVRSAATHNGLPIVDPASPPVIGLLATKDSLTYWAMLTGIIRAGYTVFVISPRNSAVAIAHLLKATNCKMVYISNDKTIQDLAKDALQQTDHSVHLAYVPNFDELYKSDDASFEMLPPVTDARMESAALIAHSSGSTSFPKPRILTHKIMLQWAHIIHYCEFDVCGRIVGAHSLPLFHIMGFLSTMMWTTGAGVVMAVFSPEDPPSVTTPEKALAGIISTKSTLVFTVPSMIEAWSRDPVSVRSLAALDSLMYAGGPLQKHVGDELVERGVKLFTIFGATEFGGINAPSLLPFERNWEYIKFSAQASVHFVQQEGNTDLYEVIVLDSPSLTPCVLNTEVDGRPGYATNDLFIRHPTEKNLWKVYGRADDQIMHSTGEKTNPGPLEAIVSNDPSVRTAVMFGRAQFQAGILVDPVEGKKIDPKDHVQLAAFRNEIWASIEAANAFAPKHSRLFKEMILVVDPSKPFQYTPKGTLKRQVIINAYADEIAAAYKAVDDSSVQDVPPPHSWDISGSTAFVRSVVEKVLTAQIGDEDDLFQSGADSLVATSIRNSIIHAFRATSVDGSGLGQNLVYAHPTVASLGAFVAHVAGGGAADASSASATVKEMEALVEEYARDFRAHAPSKPAPDEEAVLVTGTTGSLGSLILAQLIALPAVTRVYALNRAARGGTQLRQRQAKSFEEHGLDLRLLDSPKLVLLEGDTAASDLGLPKDVYARFTESVTTIIHNAWRVDFNLSLSSFKPLIRGVRNLIDLALASQLAEPPRIMFTSSVATLSNWTDPADVPEAVNADATTALGNGYGESKWVAERILDIARQTTALRPLIVRVGQLSGSTINGNWNPWEWFPAIIQSHKTLGCLPDQVGLVSWLPIDVAAAAIVEMRTAPPPLVHLVHPQPVPWTTIIASLAASLGVPVVPYAQWLAKLEQAVQDASAAGRAVEAANENPAFRLLDFYRAASEGGNADRDAFSSQRLEVTALVSASQRLGDPDLPQLSNADTGRWLDYWRKMGVLKG